MPSSLWFYLNTKENKCLPDDDENLSNVNKTNHPKKGGKKGTRWKDPSPSIKKNPPTRLDYKGNKWPPSLVGGLNQLMV